MTAPMTPDQSLREKVALKPCPFCGRRDDADNPMLESALNIREFHSPAGGKACNIECVCGVKGAAHREDRQAAEAWNRRADPTPTERPDLAELRRLAEIISDEEVARVHGHANFGPCMTPRQVVNEGVLKYAIGYHSGHTQLCILLGHGLITKPRPGSYDASLTKKGKKYARALHNAGINLRSFRTQAPDSWRPIETAPKDGVFLVGYDDDVARKARLDPHQRVYEARWHEGQDTRTSRNGFILHSDATHWMPLPAAPALRPQTAESGK